MAEAFLPVLIGKGRSRLPPSSSAIVAGIAEVFHGTLNHVVAEGQVLNTPQRGVGVFVTMNETDFKGRSSKNIVRTRALFVDAVTMSRRGAASRRSRRTVPFQAWP